MDVSVGVGVGVAGARSGPAPGPKWAIGHLAAAGATSAYHRPSSAAHLPTLHQVVRRASSADRGNLVGIVTEGDFLRRTEIGTKRQRPRWVEFFIGPGQLADEYIRFSGRKVRDVMTNDVRTVTPDTPLSDAVRLMERHHIKRLPVIENDKMVGIITRANLLHAMASFVDEVGPVRAEDTAIRECLLAELATRPWTPVTPIDVTVRDGVIHLSGVITDERQREALRVAAENIPGVRKVEDYITWLEPVSGFHVEARRI